MERELAAQQRRFLSSVSHEFRTPLAIIDGFASALERRRENMSDAAISAILVKIRRAIDRLSQRLERTIDATRLAEAEAPLNPSPIDLVAMLRELVEERRAMSPEAEIILNLPETTPTVVADSDMLRLAVHHVLSNAVKYSPIDPRVVLSASADEAGVSITIADNGVGVPLDEVDMVGQRFFRARSAVGFDGVGVGLSLVFAIFERHGGSVSLESVLGSGAVFTLRLPYSADGLIGREAA